MLKLNCFTCVIYPSVVINTLIISRSGKFEYHGAQLLLAASPKAEDVLTGCMKIIFPVPYIIQQIPGCNNGIYLFIYKFIFIETMYMNQRYCESK